jgi:hypothetical protein
MSTNLNNYKFDLEGLNLDDLDVQELEQRLELAGQTPCPACHQPTPEPTPAPDDGGIY